MVVIFNAKMNDGLKVARWISVRKLFGYDKEKKSS